MVTERRQKIWTLLTRGLKGCEIAKELVCSLIQKYRHSGAIKLKKKLLDLLYSAVRHNS